MDTLAKKVSAFLLFCSCFFLINLFPSFGLIHNETIATNALQALFVLLFITLSFFEKKRKIKSLFSIRSFLIFTLTGFLVFSINQDMGIYATVVFLFASLFFVIKEKKFYKFNRIHYVLIGYAIFRVLGTIGTVHGFYFPDKYLSFFLVPLAFSCFHFEKATMLHILRVFIRMMMIYMAFTLLYWWYNIQFLNANILDWVTLKTNYFGKAAYEWASGWSGYPHPSYVCLVLFSGLIAIIYMVYNKHLGLTIFDLLIYSILLLFSIAVMESRIGFVCYVFIYVFSGLYLLYLKRWHFKLALGILMAFSSISIIAFKDLAYRFAFDNIRETFYIYSIEYIKSHPWWGSGSQEQYIALQQEAIKMQKQIPIIWNQSYIHNQFLGNMVQYGVWGALILLILLAFWFGYSIRSRNFLLQLFLCVVVFYMMIEEPLTGQAGITRVVLFFSFFVAFNDSEKKTSYFDFTEGKRILEV